MCFVGRENEIRKLIRTLKGGHHVILKGSYGIGKTRMVRQIAKSGSQEQRFVFTDFSKTPGEVCKKLLVSLFPRAFSGRVVRSVRYKIGRNLLAGMIFPDERKPVIVLDNIGRLTRQQLSFLRDLNLENRYLFIAIVESFLTERSLFLLRACLFPSEMMTLRHLTLQNCHCYFKCIACKYNLSLTNRDLTALAEASGGYPLSMREAAQRLLREKKEESDRVTPE